MHYNPFDALIPIGLPVTIRLLDPPLHEFLPEGDLDAIVHEVAEETGMKEDVILSQIEKLSEVNPMLGFRGCRFSLLHLSLYYTAFITEEQSG